MRPVKAEYSNITYTAEGCFDLPAALCKNDDGTIDVETIWELSDAELEQVKKNRRIYLYIKGRQVPPVMLSTESYTAVKGG